MQVLLNSGLQIGLIIRMHPFKPVHRTRSNLVLRQPQHAGPARGHIELILLQIPVPDAVVGATQSMGVARLTGLQCAMLGINIGIGSQAHIKENDLQQAVKICQPGLLLNTQAIKPALQ